MRAEGGYRPSLRAERNYSARRESLERGALAVPAVTPDAPVHLVSAEGTSGARRLGVAAGGAFHASGRLGLRNAQRAAANRLWRTASWTMSSTADGRAGQAAGGWLRPEF